jgi:hypothetical protein
VRVLFKIQAQAVGENNKENRAAAPRRGRSGNYAADDGGGMSNVAGSQLS